MAATKKPATKTATKPAPRAKAKTKVKAVAGAGSTATVTIPPHVDDELGGHWHEFKTSGAIASRVEATAAAVELRELLEIAPRIDPEARAHEARLRAAVDPITIRRRRSGPEVQVVLRSFRAQETEVRQERLGTIQIRPLG